MPRVRSLSIAAPALPVLATLVAVSLWSGQADAIVYCKKDELPEGCITRPTAAAARAVTAPARGARGTRFRPGAPWHRGRSVDRVGRR
jgi:hypothetical protein